MRRSPARMEREPKIVWLLREDCTWSEETICRLWLGHRRDDRHDGCHDPGDGDWSSSHASANTILSSQRRWAKALGNLF